MLSRATQFKSASSDGVFEAEFKYTLLDTTNQNVKFLLTTWHILTTAHADLPLLFYRISMCTQNNM